MKRLLYFVLIFAAGAVNAQITTVVNNGRTYHVNKPIPGQSSDNLGIDYILLHEIYTGTLMGERHVMGKITGIRGSAGAYYRKWTIEVNTSTAYNTNKGSIISYNEVARLVTLVYNSKSYLAAEISKSYAMLGFSFTGYASGETLQLVKGDSISALALFTTPDPIAIQGGLSLGTFDSAARLDIDGGPLWTTNNWRKSIKLRGGSAIEFPGTTRSFGLGGSGSGLYFSHMNSDGSGPANYFMIADGGTGNMTIGGSYPVANYKLTVEGTLGARRVKVQQSGWADYVFHPDYQLPSLQEVEQFVTTEKHLEGIPSEKEVLEKGLDLGDFNQQLLKKVEELTLYIIQLNKNVEGLNQKVAAQEKMISVLQGK